MPLARSINQMAESWSGQSKMKSLERLAMNAYLSYLEDACAVYIQLLCLDSQLLSEVRKNMISVLKEQVSVLSGVMSTALRQDMIKEILTSKKFPSSKYHNLYQNDGIVHYDSESDRNVMSDVKKHGQKCSSICCTGTFIVETMLCVLVNEDLREIKFEGTKGELFMNSKKPLKKYVPFQIPAILAHYAKSVEDNRNIDPEEVEKQPKLSRFIVKNVDIHTQSYAKKNSMFEVLTMHDETTLYLEVPGMLSEASEIGYQMGPFSEHLMMSISEIFSTRDKFPYMTEIILGHEACNTALKIKNYAGRSVSYALFSGIGISCPNLRVLDLGSCTNIAAEHLLYLFFHDPYCILHRYVYMPNWKVNSFDRIEQVDKKSSDFDVSSHSPNKYCPYCMDQWCCNGVRDGADHCEMKIPVIDDRLYCLVMNEHEEEYAKYLANVLPASDLVKAADKSYYELIRPGPKPWEVGFEPPTTENFEKPFTDLGKDWYYPKEIKYEEVDWPVTGLNSLCHSLEYLILNIDVFHPKHTIVPFMLYALPKIKSFGNIAIVPALRMIREIPELEGISAANLEELEYVQCGVDSYTSDTSWAPDEIYDLVEIFNRRDKLTEHAPESVLRSRLQEDIQLVAEECPNLKTMHLSLFGEKTYLYLNDDEMWKSFADKLLQLRDLTLIGHKWSESEALIRAVGSRLNRIYLALRSLQSWDSTEVTSVPKLDQLLDLCPNLEYLTASFGPLAVNVSNHIELQHLRINDDYLKPKVKDVNVHTYMTKKAFMYLWSCAPNLEKIKVVNELVNAESDQYQQNQPNNAAGGGGIGNNQAELNDEDIIKMFRWNSMRFLTHFEVSMRFRSITAAKTFIESLPERVTKISHLIIRVALSQDNYPNQEQMLVDIAYIMNRMKQFKEFCAQLKIKSKREVKWSWYRVGVLSDIGNLGFNNFDPDED